MYQLVEFVTDKSTGTVAKDWVEGDKAWWPPNEDWDKIIRSVKSCKTPKPDQGWKQHPVCVLYESGNLKMQKYMCRLSNAF